MSIGKKLFELRKQKGVSQEELAIDLDISQSTISNYELDVTSPDIETLHKFSQYFGIPIQDIIAEGKYSFYNHKNKGENIGNVVIQQLSEKVFEQFEKRMEESKKEKERLQKENDRLQKENAKLLLMIEKLCLK